MDFAVTTIRLSQKKIGKSSELCAKLYRGEEIWSSLCDYPTMYKINPPMMRHSSFETGFTQIKTHCIQNPGTATQTSNQLSQYSKCKKKQMGASQKIIFLTLVSLLVLLSELQIFESGADPLHIWNTSLENHKRGTKSHIMVEAATNFNQHHHKNSRNPHRNKDGVNSDIGMRDLSDFSSHHITPNNGDILTIEPNDLNSSVKKSDGTSPVVVNLGVNNYVSASPILAEHHNHRHQHTHHLRPSSAKLFSSSVSKVISNDKNFEIINGTYKKKKYYSTSQEPSKRHISDNRELFSRHSMFAPQQHKRSYVHNQLDETNKRAQIDETLERDNLPAEMFITSPFGAKSNSLRSEFSMNPATIIQTRESLSLGATFLNHTYVKDFNSCLHDCWQTLACDTAIYQETPAPTSAVNSVQHHGDSENDYVCYLFSCIKGGKVICKFTSHNYYVSSFLRHHRIKSSEDHQAHQGLSEHSVGGYKEDRFEHNSLSPSAQEMELHQLRGSYQDVNHQHRMHTKISDLYSTDSRRSHGYRMERLKDDERPRKIVSHKLESDYVPQISTSNGERVENRNLQDGCHRYQFKCHSNNECIAIYNVCDGISQCPDGSDEKYCPAYTTEPTLIVDKGDKKYRNKALEINKNFNFMNPDATKHSVNPSKNQQFEDDFRLEDSYIPNVMDGSKQTRTFSQNSMNDIGLSNRLYPSNEPDLGIEGFFDKDTGRFITYHDISNSIYSMDNNAILTRANSLFPSQDARNIGNDVKSMPDQSTGNLQTDSSSSFGYKPLSSVDFLQEQHKTFIVPSSYNKLNQSDKTTYDMGGWKHLDPNGQRKSIDDRKAIYKTIASSIPSSELHKISINSDKVSSTSGGQKLKDQQVSTASPIGEQLDLDDGERSWNAHKLVLKHPETGKMNGSITKNIVHQDRQPVLYNQMKDGRFHSDRHDYWHDTHIASITIGQEEYDDFGARDTHSALIAFMFGLAITGMLIVIVGLKMKSIRKKLVRRGRRRSLVHEADFLINGMYL